MMHQIYGVGMKFTILTHPFRMMDGCGGNVHHSIEVFSDGSVFLKEVLVTPGQDHTLNTSNSKTFKEFSEKFPEDARDIREWLNEHNVILPWVG